MALDEQRRLNVSIHNAKVKENRQILKDLINATCFLAKQELAFRGNDETESSSNRRNYVELLHAFAEKLAKTFGDINRVFPACQTEYRMI